MKPTLHQTLAAMPARQLNLLALGAVLIAAALVWALAIRAPLASLRQQQVRLAALEATSATAAPMPGAAPAALPAPAAPPSPLDLIAAVSAGAQDAGVSVARAVPGPERVVAGLRQQTLEIEASGGYGDILAWLDGIEARQPAVGILRMDLRPAEDRPRRLVRLQLAAYSVEARP